MADPSKTEKATSRRRQEFRKKGSIAKSPEISTAFTLFVAFLLFKILGKSAYTYISSTFHFYFANLGLIEISEDSIGLVFLDLLFRLTILIVPVLFIFIISAYISNLVQVGFLFSLEPIKPDFKKISILKGFQNLFSKKSLANLAKIIAKVMVIGWLAYSTIISNLFRIQHFYFQDIQLSLFEISDIAMSILFKIAVAFLVIAILDYLFQRYSLEEQMKMSKQEVKEEFRRSEGDPQIKAFIRRKQAEMARSRMIQEIPKADVVITNPIHVAVAIQYDAKTMNAPKIVAKGLRLIAENIKKIAKENNIPIVENPEVARALYKSGKVGKEIPSELFSAVAEILTYIFKISGKTFGI